MSRRVISDTDLSPLIDIFIWFCLTVSILTVIARVVIKLKVLKRVGADDYLIAASLIFAIAQSITLSIATSNGLGKLISAASDSNLNSRLKAEYAATLLFIFTCCLAKLSLLAFLRSLTRMAVHRILNIILGTSIVLWAVTSFVSGAFQCDLPRPWDHLRNKCFDRLAWARFVSSGNFLTDLGLTLLPLFIVLPLKIPMGKKVAVLMAFMGRISVVIAIICQLVFLGRRSGPTDDPPLGSWPVVLCTQLTQCLSIVAACTVYLKPFLDSLETGFIQVGDLRRQRAEGYGYSSKSGSGITSTLTSLKGKFSSKDRPTVASYPLQHRQKPGISRPSNEVQTYVGPVDSIERSEWDSHSQSHILRTRTWEVYDEINQMNRGSTGTNET